MNAADHHRLAYESDVRGENRELVEEHYLKALALDNQQPSWWAHLVCFYSTMVRLKKAREAWASALVALSDVTDDVVTDLYVPVARMQLECVQHDFASDVLSAIPESFRRDHPGVHAMDNHLRAMMEVERHNDSAFPLSVPFDTWWDGPHLHAKPVTRWLPASVSVDTENVYLFAAIPPSPEHAEPQYGFVTISRAMFDRYSVDEKSAALSDERFVELAWFTDSSEEEPVIRVHPDGEWHDEMPPLLMDSLRYLRTAGWVRS